MQLKTIEAYEFNELSENAKGNVRQWLSSGGYAWSDESLDSVQAFCKHFGVKVDKYELGTCSYSFINTDAENTHFRGFTKEQALAIRENMPTGYCLDCTLFYTFADNFDKGALVAFKMAIDAAVRDIIADWESQDSDEYIADTCGANGYLFDSNGHIV